MRIYLISFEMPAFVTKVNGAPARTRTLDQLIKSQLLYQLSYRGNQRAVSISMTFPNVNIRLELFAMRSPSFCFCGQLFAS